MAVLKDLIVHGPSKFIGKTYIDTLEANSVQANEGLFTKLAAKSASANELTVSGLLDVHGELHTKSWSNSNIATVDGNLHIVPTITAASVTGTITYSSSAYSMSLTGAFATNTLTIGNSATVVAWTPGSKLIISGEVKIGNEWLPLGTLKCNLGGGSDLAIDAANKTISLTSITDANDQTSGVLESIRSTLNLSGTSSSLNFRNVKVAFYSRKNTNMYPIGILLTAQGIGASKTFVDMYDGNHEANGTYGGLAQPVVRIGNLSSSNLDKVGNQTPAGWGIYTSNGYFSGAIAAKQGYIGDGAKAWTIGNDGDNRAYIYSGITNITTSGSTAGTYVGTNGISNYKNTTQYVNLTDGKITAQGADITGKITANSGYIGGTSGWTIASQQLSNGTIGSNNSLFMGTKNLGSNTSIAGRTGSDWRLTVGSGFGVTNTGTLYATGAHIGGTITATGGKIGGFDIVDGILQVSSIIKDSTHKAVINSEGMKIYSGDATNEVASFGATTRIGKSSTSHVEIGASSILMSDGKNTVYEVKQASNPIVMIKVFNRSVSSYEPLSSVLQETIELGRTVSSWKKITMNCTLKRGNQTYTYSPTYTTTPIVDSNANYDFRFYGDVGDSSCYIMLNNGSGFQEGETLILNSVKLEFNTSQVAIESTIGANANRTQGGVFRVGKGVDSNSNAMLLDWAGNAMFAGDVMVNCDYDSSNGMSLTKIITTQNAYTYNSDSAVISINVYQVGMIVTLDVEIYNTVSTASGANVAYASLANAHIPTPIGPRAFAPTYFGNHAMTLGLIWDGNPWRLICRNASPSAVTVGFSSGVKGTITYIWNGNYTDGTA